MNVSDAIKATINNNYAMYTETYAMFAAIRAIENCEDYTSDYLIDVLKDDYVSRYSAHVVLCFPWIKDDEQWYCGYAIYDAIEDLYCEWLNINNR